MLNMTVGEIVAKNIKTADIFAKNKIDFCCKGNLLLSDVVKEKELNEEEILKQIQEILNENDKGDFSNLSNAELIDNIVNTHHKYVKESFEILSPLVKKVYEVHGEAHPELKEIKYLYFDSVNEFNMHMQREENVLFPFINLITKADKEGNQIPRPHFVTVNNPIARMMKDHADEGERFEKIERLTNNYTPPADACNSYKYLYSKLKEFQDDLFQHIHKENNILFPRAIEIEKRIEFIA